MSWDALTHIYTCVLWPDHWTTAMRTLSQMIDSDALLLTLEDPVSRQGRNIFSMGASQFQKRRPLALGLTEAAGWASGSKQLVSAGQCMALELQKPAGPCPALWEEAAKQYAYALVALIDNDGPVPVFLTAFRAKGRREFGTAEKATIAEVQPHLSMALELANHFESLKAELEAAQGMFRALGYPLVFVTYQRGITFVTDAAIRLIDQSPLMRIDDTRLVGQTVRDDRRLESLVAATIDSARGFGRVRLRRTTLRGHGVSNPLVLSAIPVGTYSRSTDAKKPAVIIQLPTGPGDSVVPISEHHLEQRYGLNDREARVVRHLIDGKTLRECAQEMNVAYETARWYLKSVYSKTRVTRQTELVRLILQEFAQQMDTLSEDGTG